MLQSAFGLWQRLQSVFRLTCEGSFDEGHALVGHLNFLFKAGAVDCFEYHKHCIRKTAAKVYIQCDQLITAPEGPIRVAQ